MIWWFIEMKWHEQLSKLDSETTYKDIGTRYGSDI